MSSREEEAIQGTRSIVDALILENEGNTATNLLRKAADLTTQRKYDDARLLTAQATKSMDRAGIIEMAVSDAHKAYKSGDMGDIPITDFIISMLSGHLDQDQLQTIFNNPQVIKSVLRFLPSEYLKELVGQSPTPKASVIAPEHRKIDLKKDPASEIKEKKSFQRGSRMITVGEAFMDLNIKSFGDIILKVYADDPKPTSTEKERQGKIRYFRSSVLLSANRLIELINNNSESNIGIPKPVIKFVEQIRNDSHFMSLPLELREKIFLREDNWETEYQEYLASLNSEGNSKMNPETEVLTEFSNVDVEILNLGLDISRNDSSGDYLYKYIWHDLATKIKNESKVAENTTDEEIKQQINDIISKIQQARKLSQDGQILPPIALSILEKIDRSLIFSRLTPEELGQVLKRELQAYDVANLAYQRWLNLLEQNPLLEGEKLPKLEHDLTGEEARCLIMADAINTANNQYQTPLLDHLVQGIYTKRLATNRPFSSGEDITNQLARMTEVIDRANIIFTIYAANKKSVTNSPRFTRVDTRYRALIDNDVLKELNFWELRQVRLRHLTYEEANNIAVTRAFERLQRLNSRGEQSHRAPQLTTHAAQRLIDGVVGPPENHESR